MATVMPSVLDVGMRLKVTFHLTISIRGQREVGQIRCSHVQCGSSFTGKTLSVSLISHTHAQKIAE